MDTDGVAAAGALAATTFFSAVFSLLPEKTFAYNTPTAINSNTFKAIEIFFIIIFCFRRQVNENTHVKYAFDFTIRKALTAEGSRGGGKALSVM